MKYSLVLLAFLITACAAPTPEFTTTPASTPTPVPTSTPQPVIFIEPNFIFQGDDPSQPIVTHNPSPEIKNLYINPGGVLFHEGQFHMFFNSFTSWPGVIKVGYMTSNDGYHWQMQQEEPVFTTDQIPYGDGYADVSSALVLDNGTWVLYFHTIRDGQIGRATAVSPIGPWSVDPDPVLNPGPKGAWDEQGIFWPCVVQEDDSYRMYYTGKNLMDNAIGFATSPDGINWTKHDDPQTTDEPYAESDPVLTGEAEWTLGKVDRPRVVRSPRRLGDDLPGWLVRNAWAGTKQ